MIGINIPKNLPLIEYTDIWKKRNLVFLKKAISDSKNILNNPHRYKNNDARLVGRFMENLTRSAEAIALLSCKFFQGEIIVLAGTMIEGFSLMQYCLKNNKSEEYFDYLVIHSLMLEYRTSEVALKPKDTRKIPQIEHDIKALEELKDKYLKSSKNHKEVIAFLQSEDNTPDSKRKMIKDSYKKFPNRSIESMITEFVYEGLMKVSYEQYCHVKHHHLNNTVLYPEINFIRKEFSPFDELNAISSAKVILDKVLDKYKEMIKKGYIEEKYPMNMP